MINQNYPGEVPILGSSRALGSYLPDSIFPKSYIDRAIPKEIIEQILENANWAPTHKMTEPWRFRVFRGRGLEQLSTYLADWYEKNTPAEKYSELKHNKTRNKALKSSCVIALVMQRDSEERIPEWEEIASLACAVQNMQLSCAAYDIGCYWSSPKSIIQADTFLQLQEGERCFGLLYMGYHDMPEIPGKRNPIAEKVKWIED